MKPGIEAKLADQQLTQETLRIVGALFEQAVDIHTHTRAIGQHFNTCFFPIDKKHQLSQVENFETVAAEILREAENDPRVARVLNSVRANGARLDGETQINIMDLLVRTWNLAKNPLNYANAREVVLDALKHNIDTGGGCLPGISARLVAPYANFVNYLLNPQPVAQNRGDAALEQALQESAALAESAEDAALRRALAASRNVSKRSANDDAELELALALSASLKRPPQNEDSELASALAASAAENGAEDPELAFALAMSRETPQPILWQARNNAAASYQQDDDEVALLEYAKAISMGRI